jgi:hypothetical protein
MVKDSFFPKSQGRKLGIQVQELLLKQTNSDNTLTKTNLFLQVKSTTYPLQSQVKESSGLCYRIFDQR